MGPGLLSVGFGGLPDIRSVIARGVTGVPFVMQGDTSNLDNATAQTVQQMCSLIKEAAADPLTQLTAQTALSRFGSGDHNPQTCAWAAWWFAKYNIKFVQDETNVRELFGQPDTMEFLIGPAMMLRSAKREGDCDDFTMMCCAMLDCLGVPWEIITVATNQNEPSTFSHVFGRAIMPDGSRIPMDASHGKYPGWCVPEQRVSRMQVWNENGQPVSDQGNAFRGLHGYLMGLGACGDCISTDDTGACTDYDYDSCPDSVPPVIGPPALTPNPSTITSQSCPTGLTLVGGQCMPPGTTVTSATAAGFNTNPVSTVDQILAGITQGGASLANTILGRPPAGTVNVNTNTLLLVGGLAAVVVLMMAVSKR